MIKPLLFSKSALATHCQNLTKPTYIDREREREEEEERRRRRGERKGEREEWRVGIEQRNTPSPTFTPARRCWGGIKPRCVTTMTSGAV